MSHTTLNDIDSDCSSANSASFQQRIRLGGAATVFIYEGNSWNPGYGVEDVQYMTMSVKSCDISRECQQILQVDEPNSGKFGNATDFGNPTSLHSLYKKLRIPFLTKFKFSVVLQSRCFDTFDQRGVYLVFHEPVPLDASPYYRVIWSRANPIQLNSSLWQQLKQLCYFGMNESCIEDFTLPTTSLQWNSEDSA